MRRLILILATGLISLGVACVAAAPSESSPTFADLAPTPAVPSATTFDWMLPANAPLPPVPADNPMSEAKFQLGRHLFYDRRLSGNGAQSCASCHVQALAFTDGARRSTGSTGQRHPRNAQTLTNVAYNSSYNWANSILTEIEEQVEIPLFSEFPVELGITGKEDVVLARFKDDPVYRERFTVAFPGQAQPVTWKNVVFALGAFTRGLVSFDAPYDRFVAGDASAMSASAQRGMALFLSERLECHHCHTGFNLSASTRTASSTFVEMLFFNTGLYNVDGQGAYPATNQGLKEVTNAPGDMGRFRPPTLRNIALTAPYMHDGSMDTLDEVVRFYERGGRLIERGENAGDGRLSPLKNDLVAGFQFTDVERQDLIAFLTSLTDRSFITNPRFSDPYAPPPGRVVNPAAPAAAPTRSLSGEE